MREAEVALVGSSGPEEVEVVVPEVQPHQPRGHQLQCVGGDHRQTVLSNAYRVKVGLKVLSFK